MESDLYIFLFRDMPIIAMMICAALLYGDEVNRRHKIRNDQRDNAVEVSKRKKLHDWLLEEIAKTKIKMHLCGDPGVEAKVNELTQIIKENSDRLSEIERGLSEVSKEDEVNELWNRLLHLSESDNFDRS